MAKKPQLVAGLELGDDACKLVAYNPSLRQIEFVGLTWVDPAWRESTTAMGKGLAAWLAELKLDKGIKAASACVSGSSAMLSIAELDPKLPVEDAVRFELATWAGRSEDDFWINAIPHGTGPNGQPAHLLAAHKREVVGKVRSIADAAGLPLVDVGLDIVGAANAFEANFPSWKDRLTAVVLASRRTLQIWWTKDREFMGHGVVAVSGDAPDQLALEGGKALRAGLGLVKGDAGQLAGAFLAGDLAVEAGFAPRLGNGMNFEVRLLDAFAGISFPSAEGMLGQLAETAPKCAVSLGLALALSEGDRP